MNSSSRYKIRLFLKIYEERRTRMRMQGMGAKERNEEKIIRMRMGVRERY